MYAFRKGGEVIDKGTPLLATKETIRSAHFSAVVDKGDMIAVFNVRVAVSNLLFSVFGYLLPSLNSVKAVVAEDLDGIREYMTYWVVLSISMFVGTILHMLNFFKHYSPEMKVLFVMWLTLPRFQGAYRIYTLFCDV